MATGMLLRWSGFTKEQYDAVMNILDFGTQPAAGLIFHCAGQASDGWRVFDIWESQNAFDRFLKDRLAPAFDKAGIKGRPETEFFPIHNTFVSDVTALSQARAAGG